MAQKPELCALSLEDLQCGLEVEEKRMCLLSLLVLVKNLASLVFVCVCVCVCVCVLKRFLKQIWKL
jgi:hypothetical protein